MKPLPKQKHQVPIPLDVRNYIGRVINGTWSVTEIENSIKELKPGEKYALSKYHRQPLESYEFQKVCVIGETRSSNT
jgi:hypothetical protein